jgi:hypothetical protein
MARKIYPALLAAIGGALGLANLYNGSPVPASRGPSIQVEQNAASSLWFQNPSATSAPSPKINIPLPERIDKLIATGKPEDAFEAYNLVSHCLYFQRWGTLPFVGFPGPSRDMTAEEMKDETELCSSMTERIKTSRLDHIAIAAKAGVMGADGAFLEEGPFGDPSALVTRPGDPLVQEWKQQAVAFVTAQAQKADMGSLNTLLMQYRDGGNVVEKNPALALTYALALRQMTDQAGMYRGFASPYSDEILQQMENGMPQREITAATAAATAISAVYRERRARAR